MFYFHSPFQSTEKMHRHQSFNQLSDSSKESLLEKDGIDIQAPRQRHCLRRTFIFTIINLFILALTILVAFVYRERIEPSEPADWLSCGNTSAEAIENGCTFDSMLSAWLHPDCFWAEHYSSASQAANITFFLDPDLSKAYGPNEGDWPQEHLYANNDYHILHCTYMWERQIMIWAEGSKIDSITWDLHHTKHCIGMVLEKGEFPEGTVSKLVQGFPDCGMPAWEKSRQ